jgi:hypothetical protein
LKHRQTHEESVRSPMVELIEALATEFARFAPEIVAVPKRSLFLVPELLGKEEPDLKEFAAADALRFRYRYDIVPDGQTASC